MFTLPMFAPEASARNGEGASNNAFGASHASNHPPANQRRRSRPRALVTAKQAAAIFRLRKEDDDDPAGADADIRGKSVAVAKKFGLSPKAVRDIWNGRTWRSTTQPLISDEEKKRLAESEYKFNSLFHERQNSGPNTTPSVPSSVVERSVERSASPVAQYVLHLNSNAAQPLALDAMSEDATSDYSSMHSHSLEPIPQNGTTSTSGTEIGSTEETHWEEAGSDGNINFGLEEQDQASTSEQVDFWGECDSIFRTSDNALDSSDLTFVVGTEKSFSFYVNPDNY